MTVLKIIGIILGIIVLLLIVCIIRTLMLPSKTTYYEESKDEKRIDKYAKILQKMIQVETVSNPNKADPDKFRKLHTVMEQLFPGVFGMCEKIDIDGNLLVKWKGKNPNLNPIILISHLDVVPAEGKWKYPPFSGEIVDGKIYGRGTGDVKCNVACFYQAVEELIEQGYVPECDVYLGSSCTEEIGGDGAPKIVDWFRQNGIKLFLLNDEGGAITQDPVVGVKGNFAAVGIFEKGYGDLKLTAKSAGGHSSTPPKNTPIVRLAKFEAEIENHNPFKVAFSPAVEAMFENLAPYCTNFWLKMVMHNLWLFKPIVKKVLPSLSREAAAMLQTTICFTMQKGSDGYNVIPQEAFVTANLRYIPHQKSKESNDVIRKIASKYDIDVTEIKVNDPSKSLDFDGEPYSLVCDAIKEVFPGIGIMPYVVTGGTDSRFYDPVCDACVRFGPINLSKEQMSSMHAIDENINIGTLPQAVDYYKALIKAQEKRK